MYREMTDKEKLDFTHEINNAIYKGTFSDVLSLVDSKKKDLEKTTKEEIVKEIPSELPKETRIMNNNNIKGPSIYSRDALSLVQEDLKMQKEATKENTITEEPKKETGPVLEKKLTSPNPWSDSTIVSPGTIKFE